MRGPVGSLARPESTGGFEAFDAGEGVRVYVEQALMDKTPAGTITFDLGMLGSCSAVIGPSAEC